MQDLKHMFDCGKIKNMYEKNAKKKIRIRRADLLLAVVLWVFALGMFAVHRIGSKEEESLVISWDGAVIESLPLSPGEKNQMGAASGSDGTQYILLRYVEGEIFCQLCGEDSIPEIREGTSYNLLSVSDGVVRMEAADCRDQICVHHRPVSRGGESIICLPHKLVVEIQGETEENGLDGMVK